MVIQTKQAMALLLAAILISTMIAFAVAKATEPEAAAAGGSKQVVRELKKMNRSIKNIDSAIGETFESTSVRGMLDDIERHSKETCQSVGGSCF